MNIEHDDHEGYERAGKTIYGENDNRRWSDRCRCGGTRADHVIINTAGLDSPTTAHVSNNNNLGSNCTQFSPAGSLFFPNIKTVVETPEGAVQVEGGK